MNQEDLPKGATPLDPDEMVDLKIKTITTRGELDRWEQQNIGVDKFRIGIELKLLLDDTKYWIDNNTYESDEIATRFHHRLVKIHCFPNGNGRHARLMTDILLSDVLEKGPFTWGHKNLSVKGDVRDTYINALRSADDNDYGPLLEFVRS